MVDREKIIVHLDDLRQFADVDIHPLVSPENWNIYATLCDYADQIKEEVEALLKEQDNCENCAIAIEDRQPIVNCKDCIYGKPTIFGDQTWCCNPKSPLKNSQYPRNNDWFCADGERKDT